MGVEGGRPGLPGCPGAEAAAARTQLQGRGSSVPWGILGPVAAHSGPSAECRARIGAALSAEQGGGNPRRAPTRPLLPPAGGHAGQASAPRGGAGEQCPVVRQPQARWGHGPEALARGQAPSHPASFRAAAELGGHSRMPGSCRTGGHGARGLSVPRGRGGHALHAERAPRRRPGLMPGVALWVGKLSHRDRQDARRPR